MHIILYVLDALRADHLSCFGYERQTSPNLDKLAAEGLLFERCFSSTTWTRPAAATILTGVYPDVHGAMTRETTFSSHLPRIPEVLADAGWRTAAFSTMANVSSELGFARGFDPFHDLFRDPTIEAKRKKREVAAQHSASIARREVIVPLAEDINDALLPWLVTNKEHSTFSFVWSIETHAPYIPPPAHRRFSAEDIELWPDELRQSLEDSREGITGLYDDEIHYNDRCIGDVVAFLKREQLYDDTLLIVLADHGEALYEHGRYSHGTAPYEELIHVPLIMKLPRGQHQPRRIPALVELVDIFPTIIGVALEDAYRDDLRHLQGHNLMPLALEPAQSLRSHVFSHTSSPNSGSGMEYSSVRDDKWKYIRIEAADRMDSLRQLASAWRRAGSRRFLSHYRLTRLYQAPGEYLYDLESDAGERVNLAAVQPAQRAQMRALLDSWRRENHRLADEVGRGISDLGESEELRHRLETLGYL